jgi:hypothetical protein
MKHDSRPAPRVQKAMTHMMEILSDGNEHLSVDIQKKLNEYGFRHSAIYEAAKRLNVVKTGGGKAGKAKWRLPTKDLFLKPQAQVSTKVTKGKGRAAILEKITELFPNYDPIVAIAGVAQDPSVPLSVRLECHKDVAKYLIPQVKAVEVTAEDAPLKMEFKWDD